MSNSTEISNERAEWVDLLNPDRSSMTIVDLIRLNKQARSNRDHTLNDLKKPHDHETDVYLRSQLDFYNHMYNITQTLIEQTNTRALREQQRLAKLYGRIIRR